VILVDVNVLVYAFRRDAVRHTEYNKWLNDRVRAREPFGVAEIVFSSVVRVLTHPRIFNPPEPTEKAFAFLDAIRVQHNCVLISPGKRHWEIFRGLCEHAGAKGNLVPDAYLAALAIEHGCELITTDRDFARFDGLRWRHPLQKS
jgi:toxin-antitoxin system PIN domain toxin